jgi:hypothetical protein
MDNKIITTQIGKRHEKNGQEYYFNWSLWNIMYGGLTGTSILDSKRFRNWSITLEITVVLDIFHQPVFKNAREYKDFKTGSVFILR